MTGIVALPSPHSFTETVQRLDAELAARGVPVFARIDHAANAYAAGLSMPPTLVVIFGNARAGTPLMKRAPGLALDLPLRILIRTAPEGVMVSYHDPAAMAEPYGLSTSEVSPLQAIAQIAASITTA
jgi:uncharacterized protein (DUF302 family)